jgi:hypothetical protein
MHGTCIKIIYPDHSKTAGNRAKVHSRSPFTMYGSQMRLFSWHSELMISLRRDCLCRTAPWIGQKIRKLQVQIDLRPKVKYVYYWTAFHEIRSCSTFCKRAFTSNFIKIRRTVRQQILLDDRRKQTDWQGFHIRPFSPLLLRQERLTNTGC